MAQASASQPRDPGWLFAVVGGATTAVVVLLVVGGCWLVNAIEETLTFPCEPPSNYDVNQLPAWSPDGRQIAFTSTRESLCEEVYVVGVGGGNPKRLTDGRGDVVWLAWSPDGSRIAYARSAEYGERRLSVLSLQGAREQAVKVVLIESAWSPDGEELAFTTSESDHATVQILAVDTGEVRVLPIDEGGEGVLDWSPDGKEIVFTDAVDGKLHAARADRSARRAVTSAAPVAGEGPTRKPRLLSSEDFAAPTDWWPREREEKYRTEYQDGGYRVLVEPDGFYHSEGDIPDSSVLLIDADVTQRSKVGPSGVTCSTLATYYELSIDAATGRYIVTRSGAAAAKWAVLAEGTAREAIRSRRSANHLTVECRGRRPGQPTTFVLRVNGRRIATARDPRGPTQFSSSGLIVDGFDGGVDVLFDDLIVRRLPPLRIVRDVSPDWSPDGRRIVFAAQGEILMVNSDGTRRRKLTTGRGRDSSPRWSPDGRRILFSRERGEIARIQVMRADGRGLTRLPIDPSYGVSWSPDSRRIVFSNGKRLRVINADGSGIRDLLGP